MIKLSGLILTYNGETYLDAAIKQMFKLCDEVIVVDSGSTDKTVEIAEANGCVIKTHAYENYGKQWVYGAEFAQHDWVLVNDQDEILSDELIAEIDATRTTGFSHNVYIINRVNHFLGKRLKYSGWGHEGEAKLYNKQKATVVPINHAIIETDGEHGEFKALCDHYPYDTVQQYLEKIDTYAKIAAEEAVAKGRKFRLSNLVFNPFVRFIKKYILQYGILDGFHGFLLAVLSYYAVFLKYLYLWELTKKD